MILKAKELGIITIYETGRKNGSQTANLYVFNCFPTNEPPKAEKMDHPKETIDPLKTKNQDIEKRKEEPFPLDHTFTSDRVPKPFVQLVKYFFQNPKTIEEYWKMTEIAAYKNCCENDREQVLEVGILSLSSSSARSNQQLLKSPLPTFMES